MKLYWILNTNLETEIFEYKKIINYNNLPLLSEKIIEGGGDEEEDDDEDYSEIDIKAELSHLKSIKKIIYENDNITKEKKSILTNTKKIHKFDEYFIFMDDDIYTIKTKIAYKIYSDEIALFDKKLYSIGTFPVYHMNDSISEITFNEDKLLSDFIDEEIIYIIRKDLQMIDNNFFNSTIKNLTKHEEIYINHELELSKYVIKHYPTFPYSIYISNILIEIPISAMYNKLLISNFDHQRIFDLLNLSNTIKLICNKQNYKYIDESYKSYIPENNLFLFILLNSGMKIYIKESNVFIFEKIFNDNFLFSDINKIFEEIKYFLNIFSVNTKYFVQNYTIQISKIVCYSYHNDQLFLLQKFNELIENFYNYASLKYDNKLKYIRFSYLRYSGYKNMKYFFNILKYMIYKKHSDEFIKFYIMKRFNVSSEFATDEINNYKKIVSVSNYKPTASDNVIVHINDLRELNDGKTKYKIIIKTKDYTIIQYAMNFVYSIFNMYMEYISTHIPLFDFNIYRIKKNNDITFSELSDKEIQKKIKREIFPSDYSRKCQTTENCKRQPYFSYNKDDFLKLGFIEENNDIYRIVNNEKSYVLTYINPKNNTPIYYACTDENGKFIFPGDHKKYPCCFKKMVKSYISYNTEKQINYIKNNKDALSINRYFNLDQKLDFLFNKKNTKHIINYNLEYTSGYYYKYSNDILTPSLIKYISVLMPLNKINDYINSDNFYFLASGIIARKFSKEEYLKILWSLDDEYVIDLLSLPGVLSPLGTNIYIFENDKIKNYFPEHNYLYKQQGRMNMYFFKGTYYSNIVKVTKEKDCKISHQYIFSENLFEDNLFKFKLVPNKFHFSFEIPNIQYQVMDNNYKVIWVIKDNEIIPVNDSSVMPNIDLLQSNSKEFSNFFKPLSTILNEKKDIYGLLINFEKNCYGVLVNSYKYIPCIPTDKIPKNSFKIIQKDYEQHVTTSVNNNDEEKQQKDFNIELSIFLQKNPEIKQFLKDFIENNDTSINTFEELKFYLSFIANPHLISFIKKKYSYDMFYDFINLHIDLNLVNNIQTTTRLMINDIIFRNKIFDGIFYEDLISENKDDNIIYYNENNKYTIYLNNKKKDEEEILNINAKIKEKNNIRYISLNRSIFIHYIIGFLNDLDFVTTYINDIESEIKQYVLENLSDVRQDKQIKRIIIDNDKNLKIEEHEIILKILNKLHNREIIYYNSNFEQLFKIDGNLPSIKIIHLNNKLLGVVI